MPSVFLEQGYDEPYYRYNSWRQELDSFIAALQVRRSRMGEGHSRE